MTVTIKPAPVRKSITVAAPVETAFAVFAERFGRWWPASHSIIGTSPQKEAIIEPRVGGRWYEVGEDGSQCDWGEVLAWEPPARLLLAWRITADWRFDPSLYTEVEVTFTRIDAGSTRVELQHRLLENYGAAAEKMGETFGSSEMGWNGLLSSYASEAARAA
jgi:uncharacterized protein YndB with AHSA1/START domain